MKIKELQSVLNQKSTDFALFYNMYSAETSPNFYYFSGFNGVGILAVPKNKEPFLVVPKMEIERAKKCKIKNVLGMDKKRLFETVKEIASKKKIMAKSIAIDNRYFALNFYKSLKKTFKKAKTKDVSEDCSKLREIKTNEEIECLKTSCNYADRIIQKTINNFKDFKTESDVAAFLVYETKKHGLELSFNPIVASGRNGSMPHYEPHNLKLNKGLCVIDFGVKYKGYCSDITRTVSVGKPSQKEKESYEMLNRIQKETINLVKENKKCSELYDFVCNSLGKYRNYFTHGLGHGVGVEIHEMPNLTLNSKDKIQNNMVFTIEPGVYFPKKFGIRIEDTLMLKNNKTEVLTKTTKDLLII
ncbi:MAG TPA: Xaa-Pro peptidase family protein [Candidatus Nanoarchaeia archaeon]|nr:Xaa-Pro peptidase family protein [Candidatus Nanoarchaeia archaeon]